MDFKLIVRAENNIVGEVYVPVKVGQYTNVYYKNSEGTTVVKCLKIMEILED